jgi:1,4-dihydroxy-2-naphthoyl-CoA hydrolase
MTFIYSRTIRFQETDGAGVVYFANGLSLCHEAYEASLAAVGIDLQVFFTASDRAVPIVRAEIDFFQPMTCGDRLEIHLTPQPLKDSEFAIAYQIFLTEVLEKSVCQALTRHVCIDRATRCRAPLSPELSHWLQCWSAPTVPARSSELPLG